MLDILRSHSRNWLIYLLFGALIVVFAINFGPGFDRAGGCGTGRSKRIAAEVNGERISRSLYLMSWRNAVRRLRYQLAMQLQRVKKLPPKTRQMYEQMLRRQAMMQEQKLRSQTMKQLINTVLLAQAAEEYGLRIPIEKVQEEIVSDPNFQNEKGEFDVRYFRQLVNNSLMITVREYQRDIQQRMLAELMQQVLTAGVTVSPREVKESYVEKNDKVSLWFVRLQPKKLSQQVSVSDKEIKAFIKKEEKKISKYYRTHLNKYKRSKEVRASHILLRASASMPKAKVEQVRKRIKKIRRQIMTMIQRQAKNVKTPQRRNQTMKQVFGSMARIHSQGSKQVKQKGGDLGFFGKGKMDKAFEKAAFSLKKMEISQPVRSRFGFHLIMVTDVRGKLDRKKTDPKVQREIAEILLKKEKRLAETKKKAEKILAALRKGGSFKAVVARYNKELQAAASSRPVKKVSLPASRRATKRAVSSSSRPTSQVVSSSSRPASKPAPKTALKKTSSQKKKSSKSKPSVKKKVALLKLKKTPPFTRDSDYIGGMAVSSKEVVREAFRLTKKNSVPSKVFVVENKIFVVKLKERERPDMKKFAQEKENLREELLTEKKDRLLKAWLEGYRQRSEVKIDEKLLNPPKK